MSPLKMGARAASGEESPVGAVSAVSAESVRARAAALTSALESGSGCLPAAGVERAEVAIVKAAARISIAGGHTVVALAGATGSGKSSLFNDLVGADVAQIGVVDSRVAAGAAQGHRDERECGERGRGQSAAQPAARRDAGRGDADQRLLDGQVRSDAGAVEEYHRRVAWRADSGVRCTLKPTWCTAGTLLQVQADLISMSPLPRLRHRA